MLRNACILLGSALAILVMLGALAVYLQPPASRSWQEFALGPASGGETRISPTAIHSDGTIPQTRIIGPWWLAAYRYSITAATAPNGSDSLHGLLQQELTTRLGLATHVEDRDFGIWVLTAKTPPVNLEQTNARGASIQVHDRGLRAQDASIADLADVLQNTLGKPVVDDTGISGTFNFELSWGDDLERTVAESQQSRLGIQLTADRRRLPTMIVDRADRGTALTIIARTGSVSSVLPVPLRQRLSRALSVH